MTYYIFTSFHDGTLAFKLTNVICYIEIDCKERLFFILQSVFSCYKDKHLHYICRYIKTCELTKPDRLQNIPL